MSKIAIVGAGPTKSQAPWGVEGWEIWSCSPRNMSPGPLPHVWFELHADLDVRVAERPDWAIYVDWLNRQEGMLIYAADDNILKKARTFPYEQYIMLFGSYFFTSTFAWMMAKAIHNNTVEEIGLYGIDMTHESEYATQRPGAQYFILEANRRNKIITMPRGCELALSGPLYGYTSGKPLARKLAQREKQALLKVEEMKRLKDQHLEQEAQLALDIAHLEGVLEDISYVKKTWSGL